MAKRSITDAEIALIKAMQARGMRNSAIQFYFNRPDRQVNSGRLTNIADGSYSNAASIYPASSDALDSFLKEFSPAVAMLPTVPSAPTPPIPRPVPGPLDPDVISSMFKVDQLGVWRFCPGETDEHECKANFRLRNSSPWLRAIAALANNRGGYIFFGVHDRVVAELDGGNGSGPDQSFAVIGLSAADFANHDPADLTSHIKSKLDPTPRVRSTTIVLGDKTVGILHVEQHAARPVIATKQDGDIREGDIFFRYPGQSSRIKYGDLRAMLDERDTVARQQILPLVEKVLQLGPDRLLLADLENGVLGDGKRSIKIDEGLVEQLTFIREGEFSEVEGAPTLRIVGEVRVSGEERIGSRGVVTDVNLLENFLKQESLFHPKEYIRFAVEASHAEWLPIFYFAQQAKLRRDDLVTFIRQLGGSVKRREMFMNRATGSKLALTVPVGTPALMLTKIAAGDLPQPTTIKDANNVAMAICGLASLSGLHKSSMFELIGRCYDIVKGQEKGGIISNVRRAACRIDELFFAPS